MMEVRNGELFHSAREFIVHNFTFIARAVSNPATVDKWNYDGAMGSEEENSDRDKTGKPFAIFPLERFGR